MLLPIIMICVCALLGGGTLIFLKLSAKHKKSKNKDKEELAQITANEFVSVNYNRFEYIGTKVNKNNNIFAILQLFAERFCTGLPWLPSVTNKLLTNFRLFNGLHQFLR